jgi:hypothetical protein
MTASRDMRVELRRLVAQTNDLRRRVGQVLWHLDRSLVFWDRRGKGFLAILRLWLPAAGETFEATARTMEDLGAPKEDRRLRRFLREVLERLADDLERGDHMLHPFLRWLEGRFPVLTALMKGDRPGSRVFDRALAEVLAGALLLSSREERAGIARRLRDAGRTLAGT